MGRVGWALWALVAVAMAVYATHIALHIGSGWFFEGLLYSGLIGCASVACFARAVQMTRERLAWAFMGVGLAAWMGGEVYWTLVLNYKDVVPVPSPADGLYLLFYAATYVALVLLVRGRMKSFRASQWLDGAIAASAVAACAGAVAFQPIVDATVGDPMTIAVNLSYPLLDLLLLSLVVASFALSGWRPDRGWLLLALGLGLMALGDGVYLFQAAKGTYVEGRLLDALWPAAALLVGAAAWQPVRAAAVPRLEGWRVAAIPAACGLIAIGLLSYDHFHRMHDGALLLAAVTVFLVTLRMALMFRENLHMLERSQEEALTDSLTGLRNRRSLMDDLEHELTLATPEEPRALVLLDLDGFKQYNDSFGHLAGDGLLARLGERLAYMIGDDGRAYRLGGDEFCALVTLGPEGLAPLVAKCTAALSDKGEGFEIGASHGEVTMPVDAASPTEVLQLADRRMYALKGGRRTSAGRQSRDVLLSTLSERQPDLHHHVHDVAEMAIARRARARHDPRGAGRGRAGGRAPRRRQGRDSRRDPQQADRAECERVELHAPPHDHRRADPALRAGPAPCGADRAVEPRALGRRRLSRRPGGRRDTARLPRGVRLRRVRRDDHGPPLPARRARADRRVGARVVRREPVRPERGGRVRPGAAALRPDQSLTTAA